MVALTSVLQDRWVTTRAFYSASFAGARRAIDAPCHRRRGDRMTRRLPPPWHADKFSGGYVVRDANGFAVAYVYGRSTEAEAIEAKQMTMDEARRVASNIAKLPDMLKRGE